MRPDGSDRLETNSRRADEVSMPVAQNLGVDATVELIHELDRVSGNNPVAAAAPRSKALYRFLLQGLGDETRLGTPDGQAYYKLTVSLITRLGIWWSPAAYQVMPVMTPWCVRDRTCRYDQGPESWGAPREDGYLRDDNSIIKKLPLPVEIASPERHPYAGRRPWRGFTACHIWRELPDGGVGGEDPWLYSFMPNLVWLPSWLAPLSDRQGSVVQRLLQRTSLALFADAPIKPSLEQVTNYAWSRLGDVPPGEHLALQQLSYFTPDVKFYERRLASIEGVVRACGEIAATGAPAKKLICSRYTAGLPELHRDVLTGYSNGLRAYHASVVG